MSSTATVDRQVQQRLTDWLLRHRVPRREIDALLGAVYEFYELKAKAHKGCKPQVGATAGGRRDGRVHVRFHVTWPQLELGVEQHEHLMHVIGEEFRNRIGSHAQPHVKAHLLFVPASEFRRGQFDRFLRHYAEVEKIEFLGTWPAHQLVQEGAAA